MSQVLLTAKIIETRSHIAYLQRICTNRQQTAYPNLGARLRLILAELGTLNGLCMTLERDLAQYRPPANPALDTLPQLFGRLREISGNVQSFRVQQLPAYLADSPDESFLSNVLEVLHREVAIMDVHPVVALQQPGWFAVLWGPPQYPLYFLPHSVISDPGELSLVFHEIGHVLYHLWGAAFAHSVQTSLANTFGRKLREAQAASDPQVRSDMVQALSEWTSVVVRQSEELVCDVVGTLLGGPAFALALALGLFATGTNPFEYGPDTVYPPLDCRMRVISIALQNRGLHDPHLATIDQSWLTVRALSGHTGSRFYDWLYDDAFLGDTAIAVEQFLQSQGVTLFSPHPGGLREQLADGVAARIGGSAAYDTWASTLSAMIRSNYSP